MIITAQLFTGSGWSDPVAVEEVNSRNVLHDGKLYSYLFHRRDGQNKRAPVSHRARKIALGVIKPHRKPARPKKMARKAQLYPVLATLPDGVVAGPYSLLELDMADATAMQIGGRVIKCKGKQWVVRT